VVNDTANALLHLLFVAGRASALLVVGDEAWKVTRCLAQARHKGVGLLLGPIVGYDMGASCVSMTTVSAVICTLDCAIFPGSCVLSGPRWASR
jgi:hypothetical protein